MLDFTIYGLNIIIRYKQLLTHIKKQIQLYYALMQYTRANQLK